MGPKTRPSEYVSTRSKLASTTHIGEEGKESREGGRKKTEIHLWEITAQDSPHVNLHLDLSCLEVPGNLKLWTWF